MRINPQANGPTVCFRQSGTGLVPLAVLAAGAVREQTKTPAGGKTASGTKRIVNGFQDQRSSAFIGG